MSMLDILVREVMQKPLITVKAETGLAEAEAVLREARISCAPVVDQNNQAIGVLSRTDLVRRAEVTTDCRTVRLPNLPVSEAMHKGIVTVLPDQSLTYAARRMVNGGFHRVFVQGDRVLDGVVSTREILRGLASRPFATSIAQLMSSPAHCVFEHDPMEKASAVLHTSHITAVVVVNDDGWPVGMITQRDALMARGLPPITRCMDIMSPGVLCLPGDTPLTSAASQAYASDFRRVLVLGERTPDKPHQVAGILTGTDVARALIELW